MIRKAEVPPRPGVAIDVTLRSSRWRRALPDAKELCRRAALAGLASAKAVPRPAELSLLLADDATLRRLNRDYRRIDKPTNVLAFPAAENVAAGEGLHHYGDVALAYETVAREAKAQGKSLADHTAHLVVHGVLHLLGFDHARDGEAKRMEGRERAILAKLGIADPYRVRVAHG
jgi:probable rRNA maturation factor